MAAFRDFDSHRLFSPFYFPAKAMGLALAGYDNVEPLMRWIAAHDCLTKIRVPMNNGSTVQAGIWESFRLDMQTCA
jgi:hypothetical protein